MEIKIADRKIGDGHPIYFIAEAGVNHNGSLDIGKQLIDVAVEAGADAVKFQTFKAEELNTKTAPKSDYHIETTGNDDKQTWFDLLKTQEISYDMHLELIKYCNKQKIQFLSTPYGTGSADLLEKLDISAYKIASTDTNNIPFLHYVAKKGKPMIVSTAMSTMYEVEKVVTTLRSAELEDFVIMQCTGNYPAKIEDSNMRVIETYKNKLKCLVGYSDHTSELINPVIATALGVCVFEKHFTLDKKLPGPDHRMSLEPEELKLTVSTIRDTELSLGSINKYVLDSEKDNRNILRKSIVAKFNLTKGSSVTLDMVEFKRPGWGINPSDFDNINGKQLKYDVPKDTILSLDMLC